MEQHPITPPPELVQAWSDEALTASGMFEVKMKFATYAAQWGADQELDACCEWFQSFYKLESWMPRDLERLRAARTRKPPSLKELARDDLRIDFERGSLSGIQADTIRRALEALPDG